VVRIRPRRYSAVTNIVATTTTTISPAKVPTRVWVMVVPRPAAPATAGAMSPDPVTVNPPPARSNRPRCSGVALAGPPRSSPVHARLGQVPCRVRWSKAAVARVGPPAAPARPSDWLVGWAYWGEVANSPACTVAGSPARLAVPTLVQWVPSADSSPVMVSPARVSRSQRGEAAETGPGWPAVSWT
jgi:hypothetical protein